MKNDTELVENMISEEVTGRQAVSEPTELMNIEPHVDIEELFYDLKILNNRQAIDCQDIDDTIDFLNVKRDVIVRHYLPDITDLENQIIEEVSKLEKSFKCPYGKAVFRHGPTSTKWDDKALLKYANDHEDFSKMVEYFREVKIGKSSVLISVGDIQ